MKTTLKECSNCKRIVPLWNSKHRLCKDCNFRLNPIELKPRKKIQAVSEKRKKELVLYRTERDIYMAHHKTCEAKLVGCTVKSTALHHTQGRTKNLRNQETWKALCDHCHRFIHEQMSMDEAVFLGLMQYRN